MLGHCIQEFIDKLSHPEAVLSAYDNDFLQLFKDYLSINQVAVFFSEHSNEIELIFTLRWQRVVDTLDDYTFDTVNEKNLAWIWLAKHIANYCNKSYVHVLIPTITNELDLDNFARPELSDMYLGSDGKTWHSLRGLFQKLNKYADDSYIANLLDDVVKSPFLSLKELYRIKNKKDNNVISLNNYQTFWNFLIEKIVPIWKKKGNLHVFFLTGLSTIVNNYYLSTEKNECSNEFNLSLLNFISHLSRYPVEDVNHLYSIKINTSDTSSYLFEILLDCLEVNYKSKETLPERLNAIANWINKIDPFLVEKSIQLTSVYKSSHAINYLEIGKLRSLLEMLPFRISKEFGLRLLDIEKRIKQKGQIDRHNLDELTTIFTLDWQDIVHTANDFSVLASSRYHNFWQYIIKQFAPKWQYTGQLPTEFLPNVLAIVDSYFAIQENDIDSLTIFKGYLATFLSSVSHCSLENINYLYSVSIDYENNQVYLIEIIIDCLLLSVDLPKKLLAVARWLHQTDFSLIGKNTQLIQLYQSLQVGPFFNICHLQLLINNLKTNESFEIKSMLDEFSKQLTCFNKINNIIIENIKDIYKKRWLEIVDTSADYLRNGNSKSNYWIHLAQHLSGAGYIDDNYYKLLIPTLTHDVDYITEEPLIIFPLDNYILSSDNCELIFLPNCINHYEHRGMFYNCNSYNPVPFTAKEIMRIQFTARHFIDFFNRIDDKKKEFALSRYTVNKLKELIDASIFSEGLYSKYNKSQNYSANQAYMTFINFLETLPEEERNNLDGQQILFGRKWCDFKDIWRKIVYEDECEATLGLSFIQIVIDYDPTVRFNDNLEKKACIDLKRRHSVKKVYKEYDLPEHEAIRRILIILVSIMTYSFNYLSLGGTEISVWDCRNTITKTGILLFNKLKGFLDTGNVTDVRFTYQSLIETIIKPALLNTSLISSLIRYQDTFDWLISIESNLLFKKEHVTFFEPKLLLIVLSTKLDKISCENELVVNDAIISFVFELIHTLAQEQNDYLKWVRINIKFTKLLTSLNNDIQLEILKRLRYHEEVISDFIVNKTIINFLISHLSLKISLDDATKKNSFFKEKREIDKCVYHSFYEKFYCQLETIKLAEGVSTYEIIVTLISIAKSLTEEFSRQNCLIYLQKLTEKIFFFNETLVSNSPNDNIDISITNTTTC